jgi:hypothetical protein
MSPLMNARIELVEEIVPVENYSAPTVSDLIFLCDSLEFLQRCFQSGEISDHIEAIRPGGDDWVEPVHGDSDRSYDVARIVVA